MYKYMNNNPIINLFINDLYVNLYNNKVLLNEELIDIFHDIIDYYGLNKYVNNISNDCEFSGSFNSTNKTIYVNHEIINDLVNNGEINKDVVIYKFINTLLHEINHAIQFYNVNENINDDRSILIKKFYDIDSDTFYTRFYHYDPCERDSFYTSSLLLINYILNSDCNIKISYPINELINNNLNYYNIYNLQQLIGFYSKYIIKGDFSISDKIRFGLEISDKNVIEEIESFKKSKVLTKSLLSILNSK